MLAMATVRIRLVGLPTAMPATIATAKPPRPKLVAISLSGAPTLTDLSSVSSHGAPTAVHT
jgi:hypothetical protein